MARPSLQLAAGLMVLVGLLGLSTALIAEVREQVLNPSEDASGPPVRQIEDPSRGLPVPELKLLDATEADIPDREHDEDTLRITGPGRLFIEPGEGIQPTPFPLDAPARLHLDHEGTIDGERITCSQPCRLETDDTELRLPARSSLLLPSPGDVPERAPSSKGETVEAPAGTHLELAPIRFPSGTTLDIEPGAHAQLPDTLVTWGPLLRVDPVQLPPGTVVKRSSIAQADLASTASMLERARGDPTSEPAPRLAQRPSIEVTHAPDSIRKGEPFAVEGSVETPEGSPSGDHPVSLYANATKAEPGLLLTDDPARTGPNGTFTAHVILPESEPARPYHLVAQAHPRADTSPPLAVAWSDPIVAVEAEADLQLDLPPRTGVGVPLTLRAVLQDEHGAPIPDQPIGFAVEGREEMLTTRTDEAGEAVAVLREGLPYPGNYTVRARFPGTGNVTADEARAELEAIEARVEAEATHRAPRGQPTTIEGRVVGDENDPAKVRVRATYAGNVTTVDSTDERGRFTLELPVPAWLQPGNHTVDVEAPAVDAHHRLVLTATAGLDLELPPVGHEPVGARVPLPVTLTSDNGTPLPGVRVEASLGDRLEDRQTTDERGQARLSVPVAQPGRHRITLAADGPPAYRATRGEVTVPAGPLEIDADIGIPPGQTTNATVGLSVSEAPLAGVPVRLHGPGLLAQAATDDDGKVKLPLRVPADAEPGLVRANLTLVARGLERSVPVRVLESPELRVEVLQQGREGEPIRLAVSAHGSRGGLPGVPVLAQATGAVQARDRAITGETGTANLTLPRPGDAEGPVEIDVLAESTQTTARTAETAATEVTPAPLPWGWLLAGGLALGLATAAAYRHRTRPAPAASPRDPGLDLSLQLAPQTDALGPVWHPGEATRLDVRLADEDGEAIPAATVEVEAPDGSRALQLDERGRALIRLPPRPEGTYTYRARYDGDERGPVETVLEIRIVDYREEIDREYRKFRAAAARLGFVDPGATPRELARALEEPADELVRLFERCDYSPHPVDRADYERFMHVRKEADPRGPPR